MLHRQVNSPRKIVAAILGAGLFLLGISACVPPVAPPTVAPVSAELLLRSLETQNNAFHSLSGTAKVKLDSPERSFSARQVLFVQEPDRFRAETLNPFGQPALLLATDGSELAIMVPGEGRFYRGPATPADLQRFTRLPLDLQELVEILLYRVPVFVFTDADSSATEDGRNLLRLNGDDGTVQEFYFDTDLRLVASRYLANGNIILDIGFDDFSANGYVFPQKVSINVPGSSAQVKIAYSDLRLNESIPDERFLLMPRPGMDVLPFP